MKSPKKGTIIIHNEPDFNRTNTGKVTQVLSMQFTYETETGQTRFCLFKEDWKIVKRGEGVRLDLLQQYQVHVSKFVLLMIVESIVLVVLELLQRCVIGIQ
jgi:hypothetical protein